MAQSFPFFIKIKGVDEISGMLSSVQSKVQNVGKSMQKLGQDLTLKVSTPIIALGGLAIREAGKIEQLQISFQSMLGSAEKAQVLVKQLMTFAAATPFELQGVGAAAKQLLSAGVTTEELQDRLMQLSDVASGVGASIEEIAKPYAKALQKGKASLEELYPIAERGAPILQILADKFHTTKDVILKAASAGEITADVFVEAFKEMTTEGNVFFQASVLQSKSIFGLFSTLKDNVSQALASFGSEIVKTLDVTKLINDLTGMVQDLVSWFNALPGPVKEFAIKLGVITSLVGPLITSLGFVALGISGIIGLMPTLTGLLAGISFAGFTAALPVIGGIIAGGVALFALWKPIAAFFGGFLQGLKEGLGDVGIEFGYIFGIIDQLAKGVSYFFGLFGVNGASVLEWVSSFGKFLGFVLGKILRIASIFTGIAGLVNINASGFDGGSSLVPNQQNTVLDRDRVSFSGTAINNVPGKVEVTFSNLPPGARVDQVPGSALKGVKIGKSLPGA